MSSARSTPSFLPSNSSVTLTQTHFGERRLQAMRAPQPAHLLLDDVSWTGIHDVDGMAPFFTSLVGNNDAWLFAGSNGALCAGRRDPDLAVFPYVTVDRILDQARSAGMLSVFLVSEPGHPQRLWEPWSELPAVHARRRSLFKHPEGNGLCFEETDVESGLVFRVVLSSCAAFGIVRECCIRHTGTQLVEVKCLDGWHRLIPPGVGTEIWKNFSYLAQAYMRHDRVPGLPLGVYTLNAAITDRAEPVEVQRAAAAWSVGHPANAQVLLSTRQVEAFRNGAPLKEEQEIRGETGALLLGFHLALMPGDTSSWTGCVDTNLDHAALLRLRSRFGDSAQLGEAVRQAVSEDRVGLRRRLASADGLELGGDATGDEHHLSNTLFNIMRGGVFPPDLLVERDAFLSWLLVRNVVVAQQHRDTIATWPARIRLDRLKDFAAATGDFQLERLAGIYLPLSFSRRHGDPSRPWNRFSIRLTNEDGHPVVAWQGNWRDIFQNWEALALSFPTALPGMIASFLDATSADGYNPYRITSQGVDWEVPEPQNPWAHFGYWGDHQIVYLQRLLSLAENHFPGWLAARLSRRVHVCVDIPYRIAGLEALLRNPRDTVHFNKEAHQASLKREQELGTDGRLLLEDDGSPMLFSLAEKLLVPVLAKLSNLIPGGGIWLSTQRPEWNDANNALVGFGLSIVTVCQLRRHVDVLLALFKGDDAFPCTGATVEFLRALTVILSAQRGKASWGDRERLSLLKALGAAAEVHRERVYSRDHGAMVSVSHGEVRTLLECALQVLDATIRGNVRDDGLYNSYNLLELGGESAGVATLQPMLEGQVAVLGSHCLGGAEALALLHRLRESPLYRADQYSYILYPDRTLPTFLARNTFAAERVAGVPLAETLLARGDRTVLVRDADGGLHFAAELGNSGDLEAALGRLAAMPDYADLVESSREGLLALWEETFHHKSFLGRSGTMFGFEGLGSIYWHMVSKLMLSVQETHTAALARGEPPEVLSGLAAKYYEIRAGLGPAKTPAEFGAFPTDPYSHTPRHRGAQQPGMTGQVKEELLARRGELGVTVVDGVFAFKPTLLRRSEFLAKPDCFTGIAMDGSSYEIRMPEASLAFTVCQVPVVYRLGGAPSLTVHESGGSVRRIIGTTLDAAASADLIARNGRVRQIDVELGTPTLV